MLTADQIIERFGGAARLASELDTPLTTIASWGPVNFIPRWWQAPILAAANRLELPLSTADFPAIEHRIPRTKAKAA